MSDSRDNLNSFPRNLVFHEGNPLRGILRLLNVNCLLNRQLESPDVWFSRYAHLIAMIYYFTVREHFRINVLGRSRSVQVRLFLTFCIYTLYEWKYYQLYCEYYVFLKLAVYRIGIEAPQMSGSRDNRNSFLSNLVFLDGNLLPGILRLLNVNCVRNRQLDSPNVWFS